MLYKSTALLEDDSPNTHGDIMLFTTDLAIPLLHNQTITSHLLAPNILFSFIHQSV